MAITIKNPVTVMTGGGGKQYTHFVFVVDNDTEEVLFYFQLQNNTATPFSQDIGEFITWLDEKGFTYDSSVGNSYAYFPVKNGAGSTPMWLEKVHGYFDGSWNVDYFRRYELSATGTFQEVGSGISSASDVSVWDTVVEF